MRIRFDFGALTLDAELLDTPTAKAIADQLAATLPDARRAVVPGAGHLPSLEQPAAFDQIVLPFLEGRG